MTGQSSHSENLRAAFPAVIGALVCVHASMAATRVTGSLLLLHMGYPEWTVGVLLALFAVAPIGLSLWAGRLADRHGMHRPLSIGVALGATYNHVSSKHELLKLVAEALYARIEPGPADADGSSYAAWNLGTPITLHATYSFSF